MKYKRKSDELQAFIVLQVIAFGFLIGLAITILFWIGRTGLFILLN